MNPFKLLKNKELIRPVSIAWGMSIAITALVIIITGNIYGAEEAKGLLESIQKASLYYGSAVATASATIMALMLTLLGYTTRDAVEAKKRTFIYLHAITTFCVYSFIGGIILLLVISFPVQDFEKIPGHWYKYMYYVVIAWNGMLAGHMISTIFILRDTISKIIGDVSPDFDEDGKQEKS